MYSVRLAILVCACAMLFESGEVRAQGDKDASEINSADCGRTASATDASRRRRFVSSADSEAAQWGWHVLLLDGRGGLLSGSLINSQWVLRTATFSE
jgi:hypothetical protein